MSTLKVNTIQNTSGGSSSTPEQIEQGRAKAWINFNGQGTPSIRDSFNVSSLTDVDTAKYHVNFSTNFANANYCTVGLGRADVNGGARIVVGFGTPLTSRYTLQTRNVSNNSEEIEEVNAAFFGDQ